MCIRDSLYSVSGGRELFHPVLCCSGYQRAENGMEAELGTRSQAVPVSGAGFIFCSEYSGDLYHWLGRSAGLYACEPASYGLLRPPQGNAGQKGRRGQPYPFLYVYTCLLYTSAL